MPTINAERTYKALLLRLLAAAGISLLISLVNLEYLESYFYDLRTRITGSKKTSQKIELVYIDNKTMQTLKGMPTATQQTIVLQKLVDAGALAVVYDFDIAEASGTEDQKNKWESSIVDNKNIYVTSRGLPILGTKDEFNMKEPFEKITLSPSPKTTDQANFAKDGVTRRMILTYQNQTLLPVTLAGLINPEALKIQDVSGVFKFYDTDQAYIDFRAPRSFPSSKFENLVADEFKADQFKDKIIFIGTDLNLNEDDYIQSPYGRTATSMTRIELQANITDTLISNSGPVRFSKPLAILFIFAATLLSLHVVLTLRPAQGLITLFSSVVAFITLCTLALWLFQWWLPMAAPLLAVFLCYYFFIPYRLIIENRKSWEYYQKNKLLSQVEELKTNFISMMSHDLKTPIARIQGMTDMILTDNVTLSSPQREAVDTIKQSSDDLLKFITAILNYSKIESEGVQLHLESRDINKILEEVVRKHEFLAKIKKIQIVMELEPLFPVIMDSHLMRQVFSNLVENAIKYSPEDTKILVSSEEDPHNHRIMVQVADQGPGIPADELNNIFMKFFRSNNVKSSAIKGSGLGLYLAKYFIELHRGKIFVESTHGHGSTFTVELPIEQGGTDA